MNNRMKNPWFWVGLGGIVIASSGIDPSTLTSWSLVGEAIVTSLMNPITAVGISLAVLGVFINPTTKGLKD